MKHEITVPLVNNNDEQVMIVSWHVNVGERVDNEALLVTVETTKAVEEIPSPISGFLRWQAGREGESIAVGSPLAVLTDTADEPDIVVSAVPSRKSKRDEQSKITLKARILAKKIGVSLDTISASCVGRITEEVVRSFIKQRSSEGMMPRRSKELSRTEQVLIVGDSAHARLARELCERCGYENIAGCVSQDLSKGETAAGMHVLGRDEDLAALYTSGIHMAVIGVGSSREGRRSNDVRKRLFDHLKRVGFSLPVLVDPDASVSKSVALGEGTLVGAGAVVSTNATVGRNVLVNVGAIICHDCVIEDHVHITPGAMLAGSVFVGEGSTIGMGATILDGTKVGRGCLILNNARVIRNVTDHAIVKDQR